MRIVQTVGMALVLVLGAMGEVDAQEATEVAPVVVSTVNGEAITADAFVARVDLEAWLTIREIGGFAAVFYNQNPDSDELVQAVQAVYSTQIAALNDPAGFAETVLNSMEVDAVLRGLAVEQDIVVDEHAVEALMLAHVTLAQGVVPQEPDATATPGAMATPVVDDPLAIFIAEAAAETGATEDEIRALFAGRALREIYYRAVTNTEDGGERTQADNALFQQWAFEQYQNADITRAADWATFAPETDYSEQITTVIAEVLTAGLLP